MQELNHTNGKGDKERSPGWRENYPSIQGFGTATGFTRINSGRIRKSYGHPASPNSAVGRPNVAPIYEHWNFHY